MAAKNFYSILQVPPTATMVEIKKAYRKLALQYHPDKNPGNDLAANHFLEIKKAYETLGNEAKRLQYNFNNRQQKRDERPPIEPISPRTILKKTSLLVSHVNNIDVFRMSYEALFVQVKKILNNENILVLQQFQDVATNRKIIDNLLKTVNLLPFKFVKQLEPSLVKIAFTDNQTIQTIHYFISQKKKAEFWKQYNFYIILIITIFICFVIYLISD